MESRVKELRLKRNIKQEDFANILGVSQQTISRIEKEPMKTAMDLLISMANYFNVTTDYLLGLSDEERYRDGGPKAMKRMEDHSALNREYDALTQENQEIAFKVIRGLKELQDKEK